MNEMMNKVMKNLTNDNWTVVKTIVGDCPTVVFMIEIEERCLSYFEVKLEVELEDNQYFCSLDNGCETFATNNVDVVIARADGYISDLIDEKISELPYSQVMGWC